MNYLKRNNGFTLIEVLAVMIIIAALAAVAIPKLASSTVKARQKADVATAYQVKAALDRYQVENGAYPIKGKDIKIADGKVTGAGFIPKYISKLDKTTTQQVAVDDYKGFGVDDLIDGGSEDLVMPEPDTPAPTNLIMIYLSEDGLGAEVRAYDKDLKNVLWTSAD